MESYHDIGLQITHFGRKKEGLKIECTNFAFVKEDV